MMSGLLPDYDRTRPTIVFDDVLQRLGAEILARSPECGVRDLTLMASSFPDLSEASSLDAKIRLVVPARYSPVV